MYNGEGIVVDIVEGEGRKIVIECEGLVIALFLFGEVERVEIG